MTLLKINASHLKSQDHTTIILKEEKEFINSLSVAAKTKASNHHIMNIAFSFYLERQL